MIDYLDTAGNLLDLLFSGFKSQSFEVFSRAWIL